MTRHEGRRYLSSHPWITFGLRLSDAPAAFWMQLGEARSKCEHISNVPLDPQTAAVLHRIYFAKGINSTTAIEGNSLSVDEVERRMQGHLDLPPSKEYLGHEIDNMISAYNGVMDAVGRGEGPSLDVDTLRSLNKQILDGLDLEPGVVPGEIRTHSVAAGPYVGAPAEDCEYLLRRLCDWLTRDFNPPSAVDRIPYAFLKAVVAHVYIEWIHPFGDGNGRLGRLIEFMILIQGAVPSPAAHVLTSHYNDTRADYYRQLNQASRNGGDLIPFLAYAARGFVDGLAQQLQRIHHQQERLMWRSLVDRSLADETSAKAHRQRAVAIALAEEPEFVSKNRIPHLSPAIEALYAGKTGKTVSRDLNRLAELGLIVSEAGIVRAALEQVRGMRPFRCETP